MIKKTILAVIVVLSLIGVFSIFNKEAMLGAFTTISSSDLLTQFPTTYNANLAKTIEIGTTSVASITALPNLASIGTITTGVWNGTAIPVGYGGTGTTSPTLNQVMLGNGSSGLKVVTGFGASGTVLTSQGAGSAPIWSSVSPDTTANFSWTGNHSFTKFLDLTGGFLATASSTISATTTFSGNTLGANTIFYMTAAENVTGKTLPQPFFQSTTTGQILLSDADTGARQKFDGFVIQSGGAGNSVLVQTQGVVGGFSGLTTGANYYVQNTVGTIAPNFGAGEVFVGRAVSTTQILIQPSNNMEFLGSAALTANADTSILFPWAKMAIISISITNANCSSGFSGEVTLATSSANGRTGASYRGQCAVPAANNNPSTSFEWTATSSIRNTLDTTNSGSMSATAYFYR